MLRVSSLTKLLSPFFSRWNLGRITNDNVFQITYPNFGTQKNRLIRSHIVRRSHVWVRRVNDRRAFLGLGGR